MMRRYFVLAATLCSLAAASPAPGQDTQTAGWHYRKEANYTTWIPNFVNTECRPGDSSGIVGLIEQSLKPESNSLQTPILDMDYTIHVWCRPQGAADWDIAAAIPDNQLGAVMKNGAETGTLAIVGNIIGWSGNTRIILRRRN